MKWNENKNDKTEPLAGFKQTCSRAVQSDTIQYTAGQKKKKSVVLLLRIYYDVSISMMCVLDNKMSGLYAGKTQKNTSTQDTGRHSSNHIIYNSVHDRRVCSIILSAHSTPQSIKTSVVYCTKYEGWTYTKINHLGHPSWLADAMAVSNLLLLLNNTSTLLSSFFNQEIISDANNKKKHWVYICKKRDKIRIPAPPVRVFQPGRRRRPVGQSVNFSIL